MEKLSLFIVLIPTPLFPRFDLMLAANPGLLLYGDVSVMVARLLGMQVVPRSTLKPSTFFHEDLAMKSFLRQFFILRCLLGDLHRISVVRMPDRHEMKRYMALLL